MENKFSGVVDAKLSPKGREALRGLAGVASPIADARSLGQLLAMQNKGELRSSGQLDSDALASLLDWPTARILEAADVLVAQGLATFARRTMNDFFVFALTPMGRP